MAIDAEVRSSICCGLALSRLKHGFESRWGATKLVPRAFFAPCVRNIGVFRGERRTHLTLRVVDPWTLSATLRTLLLSKTAPKAPPRPAGVCRPAPVVAWTRAAQQGTECCWQ